MTLLFASLAVLATLPRSFQAGWGQDVTMGYRTGSLYARLGICCYFIIGGLLHVAMQKCNLQVRWAPTCCYLSQYGNKALRYGDQEAVQKDKPLRDPMPHSKKLVRMDTRVYCEKPEEFEALYLAAMA